MRRFVVVPQIPWSELLRWATEVDEVGSGVQGVIANGWRDPVTLLAALAAVTRRVRLQLSVGAVADRPPVLAARQLATLDHLCAGRLDVLVDNPGTWAAIEPALGAPFEPAPLDP